MPRSQDTPERRQAIWPWVLMPLVVLIVAYALHTFEDAAKSAAAQQAQMHASDDSSETATR
jgi:cbb3-type cytochrome oxidase subunit 3